MRKDVLMVMCRLWLLLLLVWLSGCGGRQANLADTGAIHLENDAPGKVYVAWSEAREVKGGLLVAGVLRRKDTLGPPIRATVDVEVVSPCGAVLDRAQSGNLCVPCRKVSRTQGFERFRVRFPKLPPEGSRVRIVVHSS